MKSLFKVLISVILITSIVFSMGTKLIQQNNSITEAEAFKEEKEREALLAKETLSKAEETEEAAKEILKKHKLQEEKIKDDLEKEIEKEQIIKEKLKENEEDQEAKEALIDIQEVIEAKEEDLEQALLNVLESEEGLAEAVEERERASSELKNKEAEFKEAADRLEKVKQETEEREIEEETKDEPKDETEKIDEQEQDGEIEEKEEEQPKEDPGEEGKTEVKEDQEEALEGSQNPPKEEELLQDEYQQEEGKKDIQEPLQIILTDASTLIEEPIRLGSGTNPDGENYMSQAAGGDGSYTYQWRVKDNDEIFSNEKNPVVNPDKDIVYELILKDSQGKELTASMKVKMLDPKGSIKITNIAQGADNNQLFDIFVYGPDGSLYTLRLRNGQTGTISNLKRGDYSISTIIPMNYKLGEIDNSPIALSINSLDVEVSLSHIRTNSSWFYSK